MKKAQGLSLNTIVIAAIVLVVLVVLVVIFGQRMNLFGDAYDSADDNTNERLCAQMPGTCHFADEPCPPGTTDGPIKDWVDCSSTQKCCVGN